MSEIPDLIVLRRHRDLQGRRLEIWARRGLLALVGIVPVLALFNLFGQRPVLTTATARAASLELYATPHLRGGLIWEARFTVTARHELRDATLVLGKGWLEGMTLNTIEPSPIGEASRGGKLVLELGHVRAGTKHVLFLQFQTNPTNVGRRGQDVTLYDGRRLITRIDRTVTVFP